MSVAGKRGQPTDETASAGSLLTSECLAIVGASDREGSAGWRLLDYLRRFEFEGTVIPVNPSKTEVGGLRAYPRVSDYEGDVDLAVLLVPRSAIVDALHDCGQAGVRFVSVFASGFAETDAAGLGEQESLAEIAAAYDMRLLGPNCLGIIDVHRGMVAAATSAFEAVSLLPGSVSIVTQSGAVGVYLTALLAEHEIGLRYYVSTGNEADIATGEMLREVVEDPRTRCAIVYVEGLRDAETFTQALQLAQENGTLVIALKVGRTSAGAAAVRSHTAALAGDSDVFDAVCRRYGVVHAESVDEAVAVATLHERWSEVARLRRVGIVTVSGGLGAMAAEAFVREGFGVPTLPAQVQETMRGIHPYCSPANPVDITGDITARPELFSQFLHTLAEAEVTDAVVIILAYVGLVPRVMNLLEEELASFARETDQLVCVIGAFPQDMGRRLREGGMLLATDATSLAHVLATATRARPTVLDAAAGSDDPAELEATAPFPSDDEMLYLPELQAMELLRDAGVSMAPWALVDGKGAPSSPNGLPAVAKLLRPGTIHKTEQGFVRTGLRDEMQLHAALRELTEQARVGDSVIVQAAVPPPFVEMIVAARRDSTFGPVVVVGFGGTLTELIGDRVVIVPPLGSEHVRAQLQRLQGWPLLQGYRGGEPADVEGLLQLIGALASLLHQRPELQEIEVNPLLLRPEGRGAIAVDAIVRTTDRFGRGGPERDRPHQG